MTWTALSVEWQRKALKDCRGLTAKDFAQVRAAVELFAATGTGDVKALHGQSGHRIRVRSRRVFVQIVREGSRLLVLSVVTRGDAY